MDGIGNEPLPSQLGGKAITRINVIAPAELTGKHLVAEYRELPRVFGLVRRLVARGGTIADHRAPSEYVLGPGHVKFFYDKLLWLSWRHVHLVNEMGRRGYTARFKQNLRVTYSDIPTEWWGDWDPDDRAMALSRQRIAERLNGH